MPTPSIGVCVHDMPLPPVLLSPGYVGTSPLTHCKDKTNSTCGEIQSIFPLIARPRANAEGSMNKADLTLSLRQRPRLLRGRTPGNPVCSRKVCPATSLPVGESCPDSGREASNGYGCGHASELKSTENVHEKYKSQKSGARVGSRLPLPHCPLTISASVQPGYRE
jgi:hypothetical protein